MLAACKLRRALHLHGDVAAHRLSSAKFSERAQEPPVASAPQRPRVSNPRTDAGGRWKKRERATSLHVTSFGTSRPRSYRFWDSQATMRPGKTNLCRKHSLAPLSSKAPWSMRSAGVRVRTGGSCVSALQIRNRPSELQIAFRGRKTRSRACIGRGSSHAASRIRRPLVLVRERETCFRAKTARASSLEFPAGGATPIESEILERSKC